MSEQALGALLGAAVGDAVGAYLEFTIVDPKRVDKAMTLPGGGCWNVGPGQFTDDTELAVCQAFGLAGHPPAAGFPTGAVAREYAWWCNESHPFDIGGTTRQAFQIRAYKQMSDAELARQMQANVDNGQSLGSKANGAMMRATPLAIWAHGLPPATIAACAAADAQLSHPSQTCQDANAAYVLAVASLIGRPGDAEAALAAAEGWAAAHACQEVQHWLQAARDDAEMAAYSANEAIGFVKHAVQLAFYHLRQRSSFEEGLRHTLMAGGDTDTNAAIVCGVLGALHGASGIPANLKSQVEQYHYEGSGPGGGSCVRPERLCGKQLAPLAARLFEDATGDKGSS